MIRSLTAVSALATGLIFADAASAQSTIGGKRIADDQLARVQGRCDALAAGSAATGTLYLIREPAAPAADAEGAPSGQAAAPGTPAAGGGGDAIASIGAGGAPPSGAAPAADAAPAQGAEAAPGTPAAGGGGDAIANMGAGGAPAATATAQASTPADAGELKPMDLLTITLASCARDGFVD